MKRYLLANPTQPVQRGPLEGYDFPYATKAGIPVLYQVEDTRVLGGDFIEAPAGIIGTDMSGSRLYAIDSNGDAIPLTVRVMEITAELSEPERVER